ncbi:MAG: hypothetical protein JW700_01875 [Candidatus Aenigmarchaeota archaeon]|nr:hypothetical protein [Candidatus Aenigmarchaeota archaeon]
MFFRKSRLESTLSKLEPLDLDGFLEVEGLKGKIASDKLRYKDGTAVSCLNYAQAQLLTKKLSNNSSKVRLPTLREDFFAFRNLDESYRNSVFSCPFEWKAEYLDGSFLITNPDVEKVRNQRQYDFRGDFRILGNLPKEGRQVKWLGIKRDHYDRAAIVRGYDYDKNGKVYAAYMMPPLSNDCIGIRLFLEE